LVYKLDSQWDSLPETRDSGGRRPPGGGETLKIKKRKGIGIRPETGKERKKKVVPCTP